MKMSRTSLAVVLLLLAGGLSAPALVGPMLVSSPTHENVSPAEPARISLTARTMPETVASRFFRDPAIGAPTATPELGGVELGEALATPVMPQGSASSAFGAAGSAGWAASGGSFGRSRRSSSSRVFTSGGSIGGATPGLLGWGLRDARGSAAATAVAPGSGRTRAAAAATNGTNGRRSTGGAAGGTVSGGSAASGDNGAEATATAVATAGAAPAAATFAAGAAATAAGGTTVVSAGGAASPGVLGGGTGTGGGFGSASSGGNMPAATPEPATLLLVGSGAALAGLYRSRRRAR